MREHDNEHSRDAEAVISGKHIWVAIAAVILAILTVAYVLNAMH
jgi:hypothetical protein